jgi:cyclic pyranopterin phosphate synthase
VLPKNADERHRRVTATGPPAVDRLTHAGLKGARMVDVTPKPESVRRASASGRVRMRPETLSVIRGDRLAKGSVVEAARLAGIMAAKRTAELVPLCHPLPLTDVEVELELADDVPGVAVRATATCVGRTGVEMEALAAVAVACLTIYDMCKAVDREMIIEEIKLLQKSGGRSGEWRRQTA